MTKNTPDTDANLEPVDPTDPKSKLVEKPIHDPSTIVVEHDPKDPNSPDYKPADDES